jgi:molybdopterin-guanine dinucleotide biosynthesis protein A
MKVAGAIIAGGPASRLGGVAKPFLAVGGRTIAERQLALLRPALARVLVVANDPAPWAPLGVEVVPDRFANVGPLGGIHAALAAVDDCDAVVCVAGDLPFLAPALIAALRDRAPGADAVAPRTAGGIEPLCARYARAVFPSVRARLRAGELAVHAFLQGGTVDWLEGAELAALDPDGHSFFNVNTPEDLRRADEIAGRGA